MVAYVAYYRVSTQKQGRSGLGLEAQQQAVQAFLKAGDTLLAQYTEIESGKNNDRVELHAALDHAELTGAAILVAKLDRLSRDASFLLQLVNSKVVDVKCADMEFANKQFLGMLALHAEWEREQISTRTKAALQAAKLRGKRLGGNRGNLPAVSAAGAARSAIVRKAKAQSRNAKVMRHIEAARVAGHTSLRDIAAYLNAHQFKTARQCNWQAASVARVIGPS